MHSGNCVSDCFIGTGFYFIKSRKKCFFLNTQKVSCFFKYNKN